MNQLRRWYRRLDEWTQSLSRLGYAVLTGATAFCSYLLVGSFFGKFAVVSAVAMGLTLTVLYYALDPREQ
ncbi:hypothetical protein [Halorussus pelagicus]|uniref:hypothetical protein n=1 Tax=Halorussus pelagicus TaxID=2505977 RepID=UPI000FFB67CE|nr:hypothetical protein [Halorussus pelagicus]